MARQSPYMTEGRLEDVIAALQVLGAYKSASLELDKWADKLKEPNSASEWKTVFEEHPEFFVVTEGRWALLRWRHGYDRTYDPVVQRELSIDEMDQLNEDELERLTGKPLTSEQIETLIRTSIELHVRTIAERQENRWLIPLLFGTLGAIIGFAGTIIGKWLE